MNLAALAALCLLLLSAQSAAQQTEQINLHLPRETHVGAKLFRNAPWLHGVELKKKVDGMHEYFELVRDRGDYHLQLNGFVQHLSGKLMRLHLLHPGSDMIRRVLNIKISEPPTESPELKYLADKPLRRSKRQAGSTRREFQVLENVASGSPLIVAVTPVSSTERYVFKAPAPVELTIDPTTSQIFLKLGSRLDYEDASRRQIDFTVLAQTADGRGLLRSYDFRLNVQQVTTEKPEILRFAQQIWSVLYAQTSTLDGATVYQLQARVPGNTSAILRYDFIPGMESRAEGRFRVVPDLGYIVTMLNDGYSANKVYQLGVRAINTASGASVTKYGYSFVRVFTTYQPPQFSKPAYEFNIFETQAVGSSIGSVACRSLNNVWSTVTFSASMKPSVATFFRLESNGAITSLQPLDYDNPLSPRLWYFAVMCIENATSPTARTSQAEVVVRLNDADDNRPLFNLEFYIKPTLTPENTPPNTEVYRVRATDADSRPNANLTYTLSGGNSSFFNVSTDPVTTEAIIRVSSVGIDFEALPKVNNWATFIISVSDGVSGSSIRPSASVILPVQNLNDNPPTIMNFSSTVQRQSPSGAAVIQLQAVDLDRSGIKYYFRSGSSSVSQFPSTSDARLSINENSGIVTVGTSRLTSISTPQYIVPIIAVDDGTCPGCPAGAALSSTVAYLTLTVRDTNEATPIFSNCPTGPVSYTEEQAVGSLLIDINAAESVSGGTAGIRYDLLDNLIITNPTNFFTINSTGGQITAATVIDIESSTDKINIIKNYFWLTVRARNIFNSRYTLCNFQVTFTDINDNVPRYDLDERAGVTEVDLVISTGTLSGSVIGNVQAFDPDTFDTAASSVEYFLNGTAPTTTLFSINFSNNLCSIRTTGSLAGVANMTRYTLTIEARNPVSVPLTKSIPWNKITYAIYVTSLSSLLPPPVTTNPSAYSISIAENVTLFSTVFDLSTTDSSDKIQMEEKYGKFTQTNLGSDSYFSLRTATSSVCSGNACSNVVKKAFAFEDFNAYFIGIRVTSYTKATGTAINRIYTDVYKRIIISDVNNRKPRFINQNYIATSFMLENSARGAAVTTVFAVDRDFVDDFRRVSYSIDRTKTDDNALFNINPTTGVVTTNADPTTFDAEGAKTVFYFEVVAQDSAQSSEPGIVGPNKHNLPLEVRLNDVNDNTPSFANSIYFFTVREDASIGTVVGTVTGTDRDSTALLRYQISSGDTNFDFYTNVETGSIHVAKPLSFFRQSSYLLSYRVSDGANVATTNINITVIDVNDNTPEFTPTSYYNITNVTEGQPPQAIWRLSGIDRDLSTPTFSLAGVWVSPPYNLFAIDPSSGVLSTRAPLDRELSPSFRFIAVLSDNGSPINRRGFAIVDVYPRDINDNRPVWNVSSLHGQLLDGTAVNTPFMRLIAIDPDITGTLTYAMVPDATPTSNYTRVSPDGQVFTTPALGVADRERLPPLAPMGIFSFVVTVTDGVGSPVTGTASVTIVDINDNPPVFNQSVYNINVPETTEVGENIFTAAATDVDLVDEGKLAYTALDHTDYFMMQNVFEINGGAVILRQKLDYENASIPNSFSVRIRVVDSTPPPYSAITTLSINVLDTNDNTPVITFRPSASITRQEGPPSLGATGMSFTATDGDSADTAFTFSILPSSDPYGNLELASVTATGGSISVKAALDREIWNPAANADAVHEYIILATDGRGLTGTATLTITIQDINDTPPNLREQYTVTIMENEAIGTIAQPGGLVVEDKDKNAAGGPFTITADTSAGSNWTGRFSLRVNSGSTFSIVSAKVFDRETDGKNFLLSVLMRDSGGLIGTGTVTVIIGDKNDNRPFSNGYKQVYVYVYEGNYAYWFNSSTRLHLGYAIVFDNDDWDRSEKTYTMDPNNDYFDTDRFGAVSLKGGTPASNYSLTFRVTDPDGSVAWCRFVVTVTALPFDALANSGSMVIDGIDSARFIRRARVAGTETLGRNTFPEFFFSTYDYTKLALANALGTTFIKTHIFYVADLPGRNSIIIRYTALGSPYYLASKLTSLVSSNLTEIREALAPNNATLRMLPLDLCRLEAEGPEGCTSGCRISRIIRRRTPASVIRNSTAVIGINVTLVTSCDCRSASTEEPMRCSNEACYHDGNCTNVAGSNTFRCACPTGYEGPRCERLKVGFTTAGFLSLTPIDGGCVHLHLSFYFITDQSAASVLLMYTGPMAALLSSAGSLTMKDFLALELINGKPKLTIELGSGASVGGLHNVSSAAALNDGRWHRIDIFIQAKRIILKVDRCDSAPTNRDGDPTAPTLTSCMAMWTVGGVSSRLNVASFPLFVGGRYRIGDTSLYPGGLSTTSFLGQIARLRLNSIFFDLYAGPRAWHLNAQNEYSRTRASCSLSDGTPKCTNGWCWGILGGATSSGTCSCNAGYRVDASGRCTVALPASELKASSYITWKAKPAFMSTVPKQVTRLEVQFRTRQPSGTLIRVGGSDPYRPEHMQLDVINSRLVYQHNLGNYVVTRLMLPNSNVSDGAWHWASVSRNLRDVELILDDGEGYNYAYRLGNVSSNYNYLVMGDQVVAGAQLSAETGSITIQPASSDLKDTCVSTVRINGAWVPLRSASGSDAAAVATVDSNANLVEGCANGTPIACPAGVSCPATMVCLPAWRPLSPPVCGCPTGWIMYEGRCYRGGPCLISNPCLPNGVCSVVAGAVTCTCNPSWQGDRCTIPIVALGGASLIIIILLLALFLILLLALLIWFCCCGAKKGDALLIDSPYENVIEYNEEGGGQEDKLSFDMAQLRVQVTDNTIVKESVTMVQSSRTDFSSMLQGRMAMANAGPDPSPFDGVLDYEYEGRGAVADDLDSIVSGDDNGAVNFDFLPSYGPKFQRVTEIYTSFPDNADDLQSTADLDSVFEGGRPGQTQTTTTTVTRTTAR